MTQLSFISLQQSHLWIWWGNWGWVWLSNLAWVTRVGSKQGWDSDKMTGLQSPFSFRAPPFSSNPVSSTLSPACHSRVHWPGEETFRTSFQTTDNEKHLLEVLERQCQGYRGEKVVFTSRNSKPKVRQDTVALINCEWHRSICNPCLILGKQVVSALRPGESWTFRVEALKLDLEGWEEFGSRAHREIKEVGWGDKK